MRGTSPGSSLRGTVAGEPAVPLKPLDPISAGRSGGFTSVPGVSLARLVRSRALPMPTFGVRGSVGTAARVIRPDDTDAETVARVTACGSRLWSIALVESSRRAP